jgi:hypothetical protein
MAKYIPNTEPFVRVDPHENLVEILRETVLECPPGQSPPEPWTKLGLVIGPTSVAYLFLRLAEIYPDLEIEGKGLLEWCKEYLNPVGETKKEEMPGNIYICGTLHEDLAHDAITAVLLQDFSLVDKICSFAEEAVQSEAADELVYGRAGLLYILRMVKHGFSSERVNDQVNQMIEKVADRILATPQPWIFYKREYYGAGHGVLGIVTQIVLSSPHKAPAVQEILASLLQKQLTSGNIPSFAGDDSDSRVQFCHGAPGFVISLTRLRPFFPELENEIDQSISAARKCTWERGLLTKESCLCHGISGNALALEDQSQFEHFLSYATASKIKTGIENGTIEKSDYPYSLYFGRSGNAWTWAIADKGLSKTFIGYNDI